MVTLRKRTLKVLTFLVLLIFLTSFFLNYSHTMVTATWFPKQMVAELSENFKKFMKYTHRPCSCVHCVGQERVSAWFDERFNRSMQPLLTAQNALLEEDTYSWWLLFMEDPLCVNQSRASLCVPRVCWSRWPATNWVT